MTGHSGPATQSDLTYGEFDCNGERVARLEDPDTEGAWLRSSVTVPVER